MRPVQVGESVGIIAAQSIGEPGTQLDDAYLPLPAVYQQVEILTQGLPRVEELFEARKAERTCNHHRDLQVLATINDTKKKREIVVTNEETGESKTYLIPYGSRIKIMDGSYAGGR